VAELLRLVDRGAISGKQGKEVYGLMRGSATLPLAIVRERNMSVISDESQLLALARDVIAQNAKQVESYRAGKVTLLGYFIGLMRKRGGGGAGPATVTRVLRGPPAGAPAGGWGDRPAVPPENGALAAPPRPPPLRENEGRLRDTLGEARPPP